MPIHLIRTVAPETTIRAMQDQIAQDLTKDPSNEKLKIQWDMLKDVLEVFNNYRATIEANERARQQHKFTEPHENET